jgi:putative PEP-CTERM system histidine kinase
MSLDTLVPTAAAVSSLVLAALALAARPRLSIQLIFALGMLGFAAESVLAFMLLTVGGVNGHAVVWLSAVHVAGLLLLLPWAFFVAVLADLQMPTLPRGWRFGLGLAVAMATTAAAAVALWPSFQLTAGGWARTGAYLRTPAQAAAVVQLLLTVGILAGLEACLRTARGENRRRVKYLVLGLGGIFLLRFYILSQVLLFHSVVPTYIKTMSATLFLGTLVMALPIARDQLRGAKITVSRQIVYRSAVVGVLGVYLFVVAILGSLLTYLAIPEETFWGSVVVFVSAMGLTAVLLSDHLRWRLQRFIARHFYRSKYDYREQWIAFTKRTSSRLTAAEIGRELIEGIAEAAGSTSGALYLSEASDARYRLWGYVGAPTFTAVLDATSPLPPWLRNCHAPAAPPTELLASLASPKLPSALVAPLRWRDGTIGFILLGPERSGGDYTDEDVEFLSTVAEQAAGTIVTARLSESIAQAREIETFDRVTGAVLHDIKNSVSALSMLSRNAIRHFDDPEFQRDTITTLSRTVERMRRLMGKLSSPVGDVKPLRLEPVDLGALVLEATTPIAADPLIRLVREVGAVGAVAGDREALRRVVENLVTNAAEAIHDQGTIAVTLAEAEGRAVISVSDTGCGMSEEFLQRHLFAPFRSTKHGGWGIGLYQTKQVVERHHGEILVESTERKGTTFWVKLPLWREPEATTHDVVISTRAWETVR